MDYEYQKFWWQTDDGLKLFAKDWKAKNDNCIPLLCLAGLTRNSSDFDSMAHYLSKVSTRPRRVIAFDYRGRGRSDYDLKNANYQFERELKDIKSGLDALEIDKVDVFGTSRGGIHAMIMCTFLPNLVNSVILNDIGPDIPVDSLNRIKDYVGVPVNFTDYDQAANHLKSLFEHQFPNLKNEEWLAEAKRTYKSSDDGLLLNYDPNLKVIFDEQEDKSKNVDLWNMFKSITGHKLLVLHGKLSDILTDETVQGMKKLIPDLELLAIPDQGHPVQLDAEKIHLKIDSFLS